MIRRSAPMIQGWTCAPTSLPGRISVGPGAGGPVFAGRTAELAWLRAAWTRATDGRGGVVFVAGTQGMGKTRLAGALAREVHDQGGRVLYGRCAESASDPLQPFADALASVGASPAELPGPGAGQSLAAGGQALADVLAGRSDQAVLLVLMTLHWPGHQRWSCGGACGRAGTRRLLCWYLDREEGPRGLVAWSTAGPQGGATAARPVSAGGGRQVLSLYEREPAAQVAAGAVLERPAACRCWHQTARTGPHGG